MFNSASKPPTANAPSIILSGLKITGQLLTDGELQVNGVVEGEIESRQLSVGEGGEVHGTITGHTVNLLGKVEGKIKAKSVILHDTAQMIGDITYESLTVAAGAQLEGMIFCMPIETSDGSAK